MWDVGLRSFLFAILINHLKFHPVRFQDVRKEFELQLVLYTSIRGVLLLVYIQIFIDLEFKIMYFYIKWVFCSLHFYLQLYFVKVFWFSRKINFFNAKFPIPIKKKYFFKFSASLEYLKTFSITVETLNANLKLWITRTRQILLPLEYRWGAFASYSINSLFQIKV